MKRQDFSVKEALIKCVCGALRIFSTTARRDFAGIIVFISKNHNEAAAKNLPQIALAELCGLALTNSTVVDPICIFYYYIAEN